MQCPPRPPHETRQLEVRLLGTVELRCGDRSLDTGPRQRRHVLAAIAADIGRPVPVDVIVDRVWGHRAPPQARRSVHAHVARIRRVTEEAGCGGALLHGDLGYSLDAGRLTVDLHCFRELTGQGHDEAALRLWRGEPLTGLAGDWADRFRETWERQRLETVLAWAAAELAGGNAERTTGQLAELVAENPFHEGLSTALIKALDASGRTAQALGVYAATRQRLVTELGAEPGPVLQATHRSLLKAQDSAAETTVPAQLPPAVRTFVGRVAELDHLDAVLAGTPDAVTIIVVSGTAGVGKTALAVTSAHRVRDRFPDGQLYVDLRGYDSDLPLNASAVLAGFLSALGVAATDIPFDLDQRAARFRTEVARRRMLVVLDNAASVEQVRPLLPGSPSCAVVVTSRNTLAGLVAMNGAHRLMLDLLPAEDAYVLLRSLVGASVESEAPAAYALTELCARLPLALRMAAELVVSRPGATLTWLVSELHDRQERLGRLDAGGDQGAGVSAVFSWSLQQLPSLVARTFRLLGLHPGEDFGTGSAAVLGGLDVTTARRHLDVLAQAHLITPTGPDRYIMHDLLRAYALSEISDGEAALDRLFEHHLTTTCAAMDEIHAGPGGSGGDFADASAARAWLDAERLALVSSSELAVATGRYEFVTSLADALFRYLAFGYPVEAITVFRNARTAALALGDRRAEASALLGLGVAAAHMDGQTEALGYLSRAAEAFREVGDLLGESSALNGLGALRFMLGDISESVAHFERSLDLACSTADVAGQSRTLSNLGEVKGILGDYEGAMSHLLESRRIDAELGNRRVPAANVALKIGMVLFGQGLIHEAIEEYEHAERECRDLGFRVGQTQALTLLGSAYTALGKLDRAADLHRSSLKLAEAAGRSTAVAEALNGLGEVALAAGDPAQALLQHSAALARGTTVWAVEIARTHAGLGRAYRRLGRPDRAAEHFRQALDRYEGVSPVAARRIRDEMAASDQ